jgi:hypothetical protein
MKTSKEQIIPFDLAKIIKEKGYNLLTVYGYDSNGDLLEYITHESYSPGEPEITIDSFYKQWTYQAPSIYSLQEWFREVHNLHIKLDDFIDDNDKIDWDYEITKIGTDLDERGNYIPLVPYSIDDERKFKKYDDALIASFYVAIKLI